MEDNQFRKLARLFWEEQNKHKSLSRRVLRYNFPDIQELLLIPFGDTHCGDADFDEGLFCDTLDYALKADKKDRPCRLLFMGDGINNYGRSSPGMGFFESIMPPEKQVEYFTKLLQPVKHLILWAVEGNHDRWSARDTGQFWLKDWCAKLDIPYCRYGVEAIIRVNGKKYSVLGRHGKSCATTKEGKRRVLKRMIDRSNADLTLLAHVHDLIVERHALISIGGKQKKRVGVITGHFLKYGGYAEEATLEPGAAGVPKIKLFGDRWDIHESI